MSKKQNTVGESLKHLIQQKEHPNNTKENALKYAYSDFKNTYYLGYRDIPFLLKKYVKGKKAIDFGCGTGRSTRFLKTQGYNALGIDVSKEMLAQTLNNAEDTSHYLHIQNSHIPVMNDSYDLIFSCFVLFTIQSKQELYETFMEIHRCLKKGGIFIAVTGTENLYSKNWLSYNVDFPENKVLKSGDIAKIQLKDLNIDFINYYWTDVDYTQLFNKVNFQMLEKHYPLGMPEDNVAWMSESKYAPYVVYVLQKN